MKIPGHALIILLAAVLLASPLAARDSEAPNASFGFAFQVGMFDVNQRTGSGAWENTLGYGGRLIVEYMFTDILGIHSGIGFTYNELSYRNFISDKPSYIRIYSVSMEIPLCLVTAINTGPCTIEFLTGLSFAQTLSLRGHMKGTDSSGTYVNLTGNLLPYINSSNLGATAGVQFRFPISSSTDVFIGGIATYFFTDLFSDMNGQIANAYDLRASAGILFRTGLLSGRPR